MTNAAHASAPDPWKQHIWTPDSTARVPATLLSRLTEAADGYRTGQPVWFIAGLTREPTPPKGHKVFGPFNSAKEAWDKRGSTTDWVKFRIFGPFNTDLDPNYNPRAKVKEVLLTLSNGEKIRLEGTECDCIFWSLPAIDKFVIPYYTGIATLEEAMEVREEFLKTRTFAGIHIPSSEIVSGASGTGSIGLTEKEGMGLQLIVEKEQQPPGKKEVEFIPI
jgi:hypothetical protein